MHMPSPENPVFDLRKLLSPLFSERPYIEKNGFYLAVSFLPALSYFPEFCRLFC
jgi:hypothetical protein